LGERLLCKQEVVGSIPSGSTRPVIRQRGDLTVPVRRSRCSGCLARMMPAVWGRHPFLLKLRCKTYSVAVTLSKCVRRNGRPRLAQQAVSLVHK
jgi:hypothetical protein